MSYSEAECVAYEQLRNWINFPDPYWWLPETFGYPPRKSLREKVQVLLDRYPKCAQIQDAGGHTLIAQAAYNHNWYMVRAFIDSLSPSQDDPEQYACALSIACEDSKWTIASSLGSALRDHGIIPMWWWCFDCDGDGDKGTYPLHVIMSNLKVNPLDHISFPAGSLALQTLLAIDPLCATRLDRKYRTPALVAAEAGNWDALKELARHRRASPGDPEQYGRALLLAIASNQEDVVRALIRAGDRTERSDSCHIASRPFAPVYSAARPSDTPTDAFASSAQVNPAHSLRAASAPDYSGALSSTRALARQANAAPASTDSAATNYAATAAATAARSDAPASTAPMTAASASSDSVAAVPERPVAAAPAPSAATPHNKRMRAFDAIISLPPVATPAVSVTTPAPTAKVMVDGVDLHADLRRIVLELIRIVETSPTGSEQRKATVNGIKALATHGLGSDHDVIFVQRLLIQSADDSVPDLMELVNEIQRELKNTFPDTTSTTPVAAAVGAVTAHPVARPCLIEMQQLSEHSG